MKVVALYLDGEVIDQYDSHAPGSPAEHLQRLSYALQNVRECLEFRDVLQGAWIDLELGDGRKILLTVEIE